MVKALIDTNVLIDYLHNWPNALEELTRYRDPAISSVSWIEVMVGATAATDNATRQFLDRLS